MCSRQLTAASSNVEKFLGTSHAQSFHQYDIGPTYIIATSLLALPLVTGQTKGAGA